MQVSDVFEKTKSVIIRTGRSLKNNRQTESKEYNGQQLHILSGDVLAVKVEGGVLLHALSLDDEYQLLFFTEDNVYACLARLDERYRNESGPLCIFHMITPLAVDSSAERVGSET